MIDGGPSLTPVISRSGLKKWTALMIRVSR